MLPEVRDRKIRTALRTNHITGFVTVPAWQKNTFFIFYFSLMAQRMTGKKEFTYNAYYT